MVDFGESDERRRGERYSVNHELASVGNTTISYVSNISESGVFVSTRHRLPVGTVVELRFTVLLDDPVVIGGTGKVVYHLDEPRGMGVEFVDLAPEMALRVADVVSQARAREADDTAKPLRIRELTDVEKAELDDDDPSASRTTQLSASQIEEIPAFGSMSSGARPVEEPEYEDF
ncbi:MAG TPA: PilZ domain-containing protein [Nannocystaceae bacterium]|nr:PilZ domain-containing protein [Nannocystaceae bacterium]